MPFIQWQHSPTKAWAFEKVSLVYGYSILGRPELLLQITFKKISCTILSTLANAAAFSFRQKQHKRYPKRNKPYLDGMHSDQTNYFITI
jgi:hypothetical protein